MTSKRAVDDALGGALLALLHHDVAELRDHPIMVLRIGKDLALGDFTTTRHLCLLTISA
jgi:hypothetical protein